MNYKHIAGLISLILLTVAITGCMSSSHYSDSTPTAEKQATTKPTQEGLMSEDGLTIYSHRYVPESSFGDYHMGSVKGIAKNTGKKTLSYVEIRAKFYDSRGNVVYNFMDNMNDLAPGETWNFDIMYMAEVEPATYKVSIGTVF